MLIISPSPKLSGLVSAMGRTLLYEDLPPHFLPPAAQLALAVPVVYPRVQDLADTPLRPSLCLIDLDACQYPEGNEATRLHEDVAMFRLLHPTCLILLTAVHPEAARVRALSAGLTAFAGSRVLSHTALAEPHRWTEFLRRYMRLCCFHEMLTKVQAAATAERRVVVEAHHVFSLMRVAPRGSDVSQAVKAAHWPCAQHSSQSVSRMLRAGRQLNPKALLDATRLAAYLHVRGVHGTTKSEAAGFLSVRSQAEYRKHLRQTGGLSMAGIEQVSPDRARQWLVQLITAPQPARATLAALLPPLLPGP